MDHRETHDQGGWSVEIALLVFKQLLQQER